MNSRFSAFTALAFFCILTATAALAQTTDDWQPRSRQIRERWAQPKPKASADKATLPYLQAPVLGPDFRPGTLTENFKLDGLNALNFARFVAYLPDDVTLDEKLADQAQCGALLLAHLGHLDHTPDKPADFPDALYKIAHRATSSSNLAQGPQTLSGAIKLYMDDSPDSEIAPGSVIVLGHRRWILNPAMQFTAFGLVNGFSTQQSFDASRAEDVPIEFVAWPAPVAHPLEWFASHTIWSVTFNPDVYHWDSKKLAVTLTRKRDRRVWHFSSQKSDGYFAFDTQGFGVDNCLMFRPNEVGILQDGDQFGVEVNGLRDTNDEVATVNYETTFFRLDGKDEKGETQ